MNPVRNTVLLIDVMGEARRAFSIIPDITDKQNRSINALLGFHNFLNRLLIDIPVAQCGAAWSTLGLTFRHSIFPEYKSHRTLPESLAKQKDLIARYLNYLGVAQYRSDGFEADDILATLSTKLAQFGHSVIIDSVDKDLMSLVSDAVKLWNFRTKSLWEIGDVFSRFGVMPTALPDLLAIVGDKTDGIPGVDGIGAKTAARLLQRFGTARDLLSRLDELSEKERRRIEAAEALIHRNMKLVRLECNVALDIQLVLGSNISAIRSRLIEAGTLLKNKDTSFLFPVASRAGGCEQMPLWDT